jgi:hypothetical protein
MKTQQQQRPSHQRQSGYILVVILILLVVLMLTTIQFTGRSVTGMKMSGATRDQSESLMLAESAMNILHGRFSSGDDIDNNGEPDNLKTIDVSESPPKINVPYMFYVTAGDDIDQATPALLQTIANNEARARVATNIGSQAVPLGSSLQIDDLFNADFKPLLFVKDNNGINPSNQSWNALPIGTSKAASWLEVVQDQDNPSSFLVYVQAAAQVGRTKSYVQRFAGRVQLALGRDLATISQANP